MADALKSFFDRNVVHGIASAIQRVHPPFPSERFIREATQGLELLDRGRHIMRALHATLPRDYREALDILIASLGPEIDRLEGQGMAPFSYLPHVLFVAEYGLDDLDASMRAQHELTRRFTAEFSIRPFLVRYPERTLAVLRRWAGDPNVRVRRLVSEGTRPRLPWAMRLRAFQEDPRPVLELLERLKDDPEEYVRRSVANNLNDIGKDHPDLVVEVCARWLEGASPERARLVRHALRSLVKAGHRGALALLGAGDPAGVHARGRVAPARVRMGGEVEIAVSVHNRSPEPRSVVVDLAIHFMKASGEARPKVFKLRHVALSPGERVELKKTVTLRRLTTRAHHPGRHAVDVLLNGRPVPLGSFQLER